MMTPKQMQALPLLASGMLATEVSARLNINPSTISGWINNDEEFARELKEFQQLAIANFINQLQGSSILAVNELRHIMAYSKNENLRLKAAAILVDKNLRLIAP